VISARGLANFISNFLGEKRPDWRRASRSEETEGADPHGLFGIDAARKRSAPWASFKTDLLPAKKTDAAGEGAML